MSSVEYRKGYSLAQVSRELQLNRKTVLSWNKRGLISSAQSPSGRFFVSQEELERLKELLSGKTNNP